MINDIKKLLVQSKKRRFKQTVELIVNLSRNYDLKKSENRIVDYIELPNGRGKKNNICAIVGPELERDAREVFDYVINKDNLKNIDKRTGKKLARRYYIFVGQASVMPDIGRYLGKYLGIFDKMPNPKYGMIIPDNSTKDHMKSMYDRLQRYVRVSIKKHLTFGIPIGTEDMSEKEIYENLETVLNWLYNRIPGGKQSIRSIYLKLTMSDSIKIL